MNTPIEKLLDAVDWKAVPQPAEIDLVYPHVTHTGVLRLWGFSYEAVQLSNGQRTITEESLLKWLGAVDLHP